MERVTFPLLSAQDIYTHLRFSLELQVLSEADLLNPKPDNIKELYSTLIEVCLKRPRFEFMRPSQDQLLLLKYPEQHDRATELLSLFSHVRKLLDKIGCKGEFKINDFFKPEFKRHRRFLSAIINFIKFSTEETAMIFVEDNLKTSTDKAKADLQRVKAELDRIQNDITQLRRKKLEVIPIIAEKEQRIQELLNKIKENNEEHVRLENETSGLNDKIQAYCKHIDEVKEQRDDLARRLDNSKELLVSSPDKVVEQLEHLRNLLDEEKKEIVIEQNTNFELASQKELVEEVKLKLYKAKLLLESHADHIGRVDALKAEQRMLKTKIAEAESEMNKKQYTLKYLESQSILQEEAALRERKANEHRLFSLEQHFDQKQAELRKAAETSAELKSQLRKCEEDYEALQNEKQRLLASHEMMVRQDMETMQLFRQEIGNYWRNLRSFFEARGVVSV
mmetsp:Transcript_10783/g.21081  ORF Transcript_10783/g.21081 Transcript_10783/m.21081 type:complete len:450 (-) Transcript_10783:1575-2924(-)